MWILLAFNLSVPICTSLSLHHLNFVIIIVKVEFVPQWTWGITCFVPFSLWRPFILTCFTGNWGPESTSDFRTQFSYYINYAPTLPLSHGGELSSSLLEQSAPAAWRVKVQEPGWCALLLHFCQGEAQLKIANKNGFLYDCFWKYIGTISKGHKLSQFQEI